MTRFLSARKKGITGSSTPEDISRKKVVVRSISAYLY
jgi:hypothetical protein